MTARFRTPTPWLAPMGLGGVPRPTRGHDDASAGHPATGATAPPVDKSDWLWCNCCKKLKPPAGRAGFRCSDCSARAATVPKSYVEPEPYKVLYDSEGNLIKQPKKKKATGAATPVTSDTANERNEE